MGGCAEAAWKRELRQEDVAYVADKASVQAEYERRIAECTALAAANPEESEARKSQTLDWYFTVMALHYDIHHRKVSQIFEEAYRHAPAK